MWAYNWLERLERERRRAERPGSPDEIHVRSFQTNWDETRFIVEGRRLGIHLGERQYPTHADALAYAKMLCGWEGAKLVDHVGGKPTRGQGAGQ